MVTKNHSRTHACWAWVCRQGGRDWNNPYFEFKKSGIKESYVGLGDDIEYVDEHHDGEYSNEVLTMPVSEFLDTLKSRDEEAYEAVEVIIEKFFNTSGPTDVKNSQWFSDVDGERIIDKQVD